MQTRLISGAAQAAALTLALHLFTLPTADATDAPKAEPAQGVHIQLLSFVAPIDPPSEEGQDTISITIFLDVGSEERIAKVCRQSPRLRNAILETLYAHPIRLGPGNKLGLDAVRPLVVAASNRAIGRDLVSDAIVLAGPRGLGGGTGQKMPFGQIMGCSTVKGSKASPPP